MKRMILLTLLLMLGIGGKAQIVRQGNVFKQDTTKVVNTGTKTSFEYEDAKGIKYPIYITKSGAVYVIKVSKKSGKEYKMYLPKDVREAVNKEIKKQETI